MEQEAKISISVKDGIVEITGSEAFVREQIENFKGLILENLKNVRVPSSERLPSKDQVIPPVASHTVPGNYQNVISHEGDNIKIIKDIPGKGKKEKILNAALIYIFAKSLKGEESATFKEIKKVCEDHGFLDKGNFSQIIKKQKELFNISGSPKNQSAKLTVPGKAKAKDLVSELNSQ